MQATLSYFKSSLEGGGRKAVRLFVFLEEDHVDHQGQGRRCEEQAQGVGVAGEEAAELVDHQGDEVGEAALVADREPGPFGAVHLPFDRADGGEARGAQEVKDQERIAGDRREGL